jgi:hypothetical protein
MPVTIEEAVEAYIAAIKKKRYIRFDKKAAANLLKGSDAGSENKPVLKDNDFTFLRQDGFNPQMMVNDPEAEVYIDKAITSSLKKYPKSKITGVAVYKHFLEFINEQCGTSISIAFPEWLPGTTLERRIQIAKMLQDPGTELSQVEDSLYIGSKTISNDLKLLKGEDDDALEVMGQTLTVDIERRRGSVTFPSTVHPLFLTFNLTQVITMLEGLKKMSEDMVYKNYAVVSGKMIWSQLSDYAKRRIFTVSEGLEINTDWYKSLDTDINKVKNLFNSEMRCSSEYGGNSLAYCYKNGQTCFIDYLDADGKTIIYENYRIVSFPDDKVIIEKDCQQLVLQTDRIVKAALTGKELY